MTIENVVYPISHSTNIALLLILSMFLTRYLRITILVEMVGILKWGGKQVYMGVNWWGTCMRISIYL